MQIGELTIPDTVAARKYELALVVNPEIADKEREELLDWVRKMITSWGGEVDRTLEEGKKTLAYEIEGFGEAYYYYVKMSMPVDKTNDLDLKIKYDERVIRHLLVKDEA